MRLVEIGRRLRELRLARGYSQAELASLAGVTRSTLSRLENGTLSDLGATKLLALLELAGGELTVVPRRTGGGSDPLARAVSAANVSSRGRLYPDELVHALLTGVPVPHKRGQVHAALEDLSDDRASALVRQVGDLSGRSAERIESALGRLRRSRIDAR